MATVPVLSSIIAPNSLWSATVNGKQMRRTRRVQNGGGYMQVNVEWANTLRQYEIGSVPMRVDVWATLEGLYEATDFGAYGFLLQDPKDSSVTVANGVASLVDASDPMYQLRKRYTSAGSALYHDRRITRPRANNLSLFINGVAEMSYTLDDETGQIIIPSAPSASAISWSGSFYVPVHFERDDLDWTLAIAGAESSRYMLGPNVTLLEVRE
jgi:uncharacterized protein (TIGR02217 family)